MKNSATASSKLDKPMIIANWKSNKNSEEVKAWLAEFAAQKIPSGVEIVIAPPYPFLAMTQAAIAEFETVAVATQDLSPYPAGSYTGAVSQRNLENLGVAYALVGHSERRQYFGETNQLVANKVSQALAAGITPVVCVDEPYLSDQVAALSDDQIANCVWAYEPVSAIGTGQSQPIEEVVEVVSRVRRLVGQQPVLYGGSVTAQNVSVYLAETDGVLVGGASLDVEKFMALVNQAQLG